jgi:hypothetical protein
VEELTMETRSTQNRWSIASGRQEFPALVKAANASGMQLIFNRNELVAAVVGRETVETLLVREGGKKRYPSGKEVIRAMIAWHQEAKERGCSLLGEDEESFPRDKSPLEFRDQFSEEDSPT